MIESINIVKNLDKTKGKEYRVIVFRSHPKECDTKYKNLDEMFNEVFKGELELDELSDPKEKG